MVQAVSDGRKPKGDGTVGAVLLAAVGGLVLVLINVQSSVAQLAPLFHAAAGADAAAHAGDVVGGVLGYLLGSTLVCVAVPWAIMYWTWVHRRAPGRAVPYLLIIGAVVLIAELAVVRVAAIATRAQDDARVVADLHSTVDAIQRDGPNAKIDTAPVAGGDAGIAGALTKQLLAAVEADNGAYVRDLKATGVMEVLTPPRLASENLTAAAAVIDKARAVVTKYRALADTRIAAYRQAVEQSAMSDASKRSLLAGADSATPEAKADHDRMWDAEAAILDDASKMIALLRRSRAAWGYDGRQMVFNDPAVMATYNGYVEDMQAKTAFQRSLRGQVVAQAEQQLSPLAQP